MGRVPAGRQSPAGTYWRVTDVATEAAGGPRADLRAVIEESVAAHLVADVPVAILPQRRSGLQHRHRAGEAARPGIESYTITFRAQDQRLEAMPDDAIYARKMAEQLGIRLHEIEIAPDVVELLPRMVDILDEPIGDPAAINTLLMCDAARAAGVKVLLSGMGADELFGGYRKHLACLLAGATGALPGVLRSGLVGPTVRRLPVTVSGRGLRYARWAQAVHDLRQAVRGDGVPAQLHAVRRGPSWPVCSSPDLAVRRGSARRAPRRSTPTPPRRPRQPDVPGRLPDVHAGAQPGLHRPGQHGRVDRGPRPFVDPIVAQAAFSIPGSEKIRGR